MINVYPQPPVPSYPLGNKNGFLDAFGRQRVSQPLTLIDNKLLFDDHALYWDSSQTSGSGTTDTYNTNQSSRTLLTTTSTAGTRVIQTKMRFNYQTGKAQTIFITLNPNGGATGMTKRWGYFDGNNGIFFQLSGTTLSVVRRTFTSGSPVEEVVAQSSWNYDKLDGTGPSGITLDTTKTCIYWIGFEWLGVGSVFVGVVINGQYYPVHTFNHSNILTLVYMTTPNLPVRYEISNSGTGTSNLSMDCICSTVMSEGGSERLGKPISVDRGSSYLSVNNNTNIYPVISIRLKSTHLGSSVNIDGFTMLTTATGDFRWQIILNPTIGGVDAASWVSVTNSSIEYDISRTATNTLTGGYVLASGYAQLQNTSGFIQAAVQGRLRLGATIAGVSDQIVLAYQSVPSGINSQTVTGSFQLNEEY